MTEKLHIFALNTDLDQRHTHLTRAQGDRATLPPLTGWLQLEALDTDRIELFPVADLGDMRLSDYITDAFAPRAPIPSDMRARLDTLSGTVMLVPETAMTGTPAPDGHATAIAALDLAQPDHHGRLPKAPLTPAPRTAPMATAPAPKPVGRRALVGAAAAALVLLFVLVVLF